MSGKVWHHFTTPSDSQDGVEHYTTLPGNLDGPGACTCPGQQYAKRGGECKHIREYRKAIRMLYRAEWMVTENMRHPTIVQSERAAVPAVGEPSDLFR